MHETLDRLDAAVQAMVEVLNDENVRAEFSDGDEEMLTNSLGALIEYKESLEDSIPV